MLRMHKKKENHPCNADFSEPSLLSAAAACSDATCSLTYGKTEFSGDRDVEEAASICNGSPPQSQTSVCQSLFAYR